MQLLIGLDYELFFGEVTGTVEKCLIEPSEALVKVLNRHGQRVTMFVDSGFLARLRATGQTQTLSTVQTHLRSLAAQGHDLQLHIHPHWEDSDFVDGRWRLDTSRYRLQNFTADEIQEIVKRYKDELEQCAESEVFAYRAGGWCIQPFAEIASALKDNGVWLDSTVFKHGTSTNENREFDFSRFPDKSSWRFSEDPTIEDPDGYFYELPIGSILVSPTFFWELAIRRKLASSSLKSYGDGGALANSKSYYLDRLTRSSYSPVSLDGLKAGLLSRAYREQKQMDEQGVLNVMGHPKSLTPYSIQKLDQFLQQHKLEPATCQSFKHEQPG